MAKQRGIPSVPGGGVMPPLMYGGQSYTTGMDASFDALGKISEGQRVSGQVSVPMNADAVDMQNSYIQMLNEQIQQNTDYDKQVTDNFNANGRFNDVRQEFKTPNNSRASFTPWSTGSSYIGAPMQSQRGEFVPYEKPEYSRESFSAGKSFPPKAGAGPDRKGKEPVDFHTNGELQVLSRTGDSLMALYTVRDISDIDSRQMNYAANYVDTSKFENEYKSQGVAGSAAQKKDIEKLIKDKNLGNDVFRDSHQVYKFENGELKANVKNMLLYDKNNNSLVEVKVQYPSGDKMVEDVVKVGVSGAYGFYGGMSPKDAIELKAKQEKQIKDALTATGTKGITKLSAAPLFDKTKLTAANKVMENLFEKAYGDSKAFHQKFQNYAMLKDYDRLEMDKAKKKYRDYFIRQQMWNLIKWGRP